MFTPQINDQLIFNSDNTQTMRPFKTRLPTYAVGITSQTNISEEVFGDVFSPYEPNIGTGIGTGIGNRARGGADGEIVFLF